MNYYEKIKDMTIEEMAKVIECPDDIDEKYDTKKSCKDEYNKGEHEKMSEICFNCCLEFLKSESIK